MAACECGSLGKAAAKLYTTQPNVSKVIRQLERELGKDLFERTSKGLRLTPYGKSVQQYAAAILKNADLLLHGDNGMRQEEFSVSTYRSNVIAWLLVELHKAYPDLIISHRQGTVEEITSQVSQGISEVGVLYVSEKQLKAFRHIIHHKRLHFVELTRCQASIYVGPNSPYYHRQSVSKEELSSLSFVRELKDYFSMEHHFEQVSMAAVSAEKLHPIVFTNSEHLSTAMVLETDVADLGIGLTHAEGDQYAIRSIAVEGVDTQLVLGYVLEQDHTVSAVCKTFLDKLEKKVSVCHNKM